MYDFGIIFPYMTPPHRLIIFIFVLVNHMNTPFQNLKFNFLYRLNEEYWYNLMMIFSWEMVFKIITPIGDTWFQKYPEMSLTYPVPYQIELYVHCY